MGVFAAIIITAISATGLALMLVPGTETGRAELDGPIINVLYGRVPSYGPVGVELGDGWVVQIDQSLYVVETPVGDFAGELRGAVETENGVFVASDNLLLLIDGDGSVLDRLEPPLLPGRVDAIGRGPGGNLSINTPDGAFSADTTLSFWQPMAEEAVEWSVVARPPRAASQSALQAHRGGGVPFERLLADLHTGRLFGVLGEVLVWIATIIMIGLSMSGGWMWWRRLRPAPRTKDESPNDQPSNRRGWLSGAASSLRSSRKSSSKRRRSGSSGAKGSRRSQ